MYFLSLRLSKNFREYQLAPCFLAGEIPYNRTGLTLNFILALFYVTVRPWQPENSDYIKCYNNPYKSPHKTSITPPLQRDSLRYFLSIWRQVAWAQALKDAWDSISEQLSEPGTGISTQVSLVPPGPVLLSSQLIKGMTKMNKHRMIKLLLNIFIIHLNLFNHNVFICNWKTYIYQKQIGFQIILFL